jgi:hypothetical protein
VLKRKENTKENASTGTVHIVVLISLTVCSMNKSWKRWGNVEIKDSTVVENSKPIENQEPSANQRKNSKEDQSTSSCQESKETKKPKKKKEFCCEEW